jgi:hypothetical protein
MSDNITKIKSSIQELKNLSKILIPYNYPIKNSEAYEEDLLIFKSRKYVVDGYSVVVHYQRCDYEHYYMDVLQLYGDYSTFLPISVNCKIAKLFLGNDELFLIETYKQQKKIYCWTVCLNKEERVIESPIRKDGDYTHRFYDGFKYFYIPPSKVFFI